MMVNRKTNVLVYSAITKEESRGDRLCSTILFVAIHLVLHVVSGMRVHNLVLDVVREIGGNRNLMGGKSFSLFGSSNQLNGRGNLQVTLPQLMFCRP